MHSTMIRIATFAVMLAAIGCASRQDNAGLAQNIAACERQVSNSGLEPYGVADATQLDRANVNRFGSPVAANMAHASDDAEMGALMPASFTVSGVRTVGEWRTRMCSAMNRGES